MLEREIQVLEGVLTNLRAEQKRLQSLSKEAEADRPSCYGSMSWGSMSECDYCSFTEGCLEGFPAFQKNQIKADLHEH